MGVIDPITATQCVKAITLPWVFPSCKLKGVKNLAEIVDQRRFGHQQAELVIQKADVKGGIMDNEFSPFDKAQEIAGNVLKMRLVGQKLLTEAMDFNRACVNLSLGVEIDVKMISAEFPIE